MVSQIPSEMLNRLISRPLKRANPNLDPSSKIWISNLYPFPFRVSREKSPKELNEKSYPENAPGKEKSQLMKTSAFHKKIRIGFDWKCSYLMGWGVGVDLRKPCSSAGMWNSCSSQEKLGEFPLPHGQQPSPHSGHLAKPQIHWESLNRRENF